VKTIIIILSMFVVTCMENNVINPVIDNRKTVTTCYSPINNTDFKIVWYMATIFLEGDSVGIVYPDSTCLSIKANPGDSVVAIFSADVISNGKKLTTKYIQHLVVGKTDTLFVIP